MVGEILEKVAGTTGLEPAASAVTGQRSNQLNYVPTPLKIRDFLVGTPPAVFLAAHDLPQASCVTKMVGDHRLELWTSCL